jgi:hypothetical protein
MYVLDTSVADRHCVDADPDPNFHFDANLDPDPDWHQNDSDPHADPTPSFANAGIQCCGSGSGIGCFLTPGSGIRNRFFPDPGSQISDPGSQDHIFKSFLTIFLVKISIIL